MKAPLAFPNPPIERPEDRRARLFFAAYQHECARFRVYPDDLVPARALPYLNAYDATGGRLVWRGPRHYVTFPNRWSYEYNRDIPGV